MFSVTINGNTIEELYANVEAILANKPGANAQAYSAAPVPPAQPTAPAAPPAVFTAPPAQVPHANPLTQPPAMPPQQPAAVAPPAQMPPAPPAAPAQPPAAAAPTYTLDQLAKAGAALAQSGQMEAALALLARYGVQTVNQLQPEQYGAFATELRALGAQV